MKLALLFALLIVPALPADSRTPDLPQPGFARNIAVGIAVRDFIPSPVDQKDRQNQTTIAASAAAMTIGDFTFRIVGVVFDKTAFGLVPMDFAASDRVMIVEFELLSGNRDSFRNLLISLAGPSGQKFNAILMASDGMIKALTTVTIKGDSSGYKPGKDNIAWAFAVPKGTRELYLNFSSWELIDLSPLIKQFH